MHKVLTNIFLLQKVIDCFEERQGSGILLDKDRFLLLQSSIVDKALMCPNSNFELLEQSIQNSGKFNFLFFLVRKRVAFISARLRGSSWLLEFSSTFSSFSDRTLSYMLVSIEKTKSFVNKNIS